MPQKSKRKRTQVLNHDTSSSKPAKKNIAKNLIHNVTNKSKHKRKDHDTTELKLQKEIEVTIDRDSDNGNDDEEEEEEHETMVWELATDNHPTDIQGQSNHDIQDVYQDNEATSTGAPPTVPRELIIEAPKIPSQLQDSNEKSKKIPVQPKRVNNIDYEALKLSLDFHISTIALAIGTIAIRADDTASDLEVQNLARSKLWPKHNKSKSTKHHWEINGIRTWLLEFHSKFIILPSGSATIQKCSLKERVKIAINERKGEPLDIVTMLVAAFRGSGLRTRFVLYFEPADRKRPLTAKSPFELTIFHPWLEFWQDHESRWVSCDFIFSLIDAPQDHASHVFNSSLLFPNKPQNHRGHTIEYESTAFLASKKKKILPHVVAVENTNVVDVTRRYVQSWPEVEILRAPGLVFQNVIRNLSKTTKRSVRIARKKHTDKEEDDHALKSERKEFESLHSKEPIPTSQQKIKNHPKYVIEKHLKKYEVLYPDPPPVLGFCNGLPVYSRACVHELHSRERWERLLRYVRDDEEPYKVMDSTRSQSSSSVDLFGIWQTDKLIVPYLQDGIVPKNERGKYNLWTEDHLPGGCAYIKIPYASSVARKLGVDYAVAMVGFEIRRGRSVPIYEGIIVPEYDKKLITDAAVTEYRKRQEMAAEKKEKEILSRWRLLFRSIEARARVKRKYGGAFTSDLTFEKELKTKSDGQKKNKTSNLQEVVPIEKEPLTKAHEHLFGDSYLVDEEDNLWGKKCNDCGLAVTFHKL